MLKVWNFGSTTVRNPNRIQDGLRVYRDIGGSVYGSVDERNFLQSLYDEDVTDSIPVLDDSMSFNGRKWRSTFFKLGFVGHQRYKINGENISHFDFSNLFQDFQLSGRNYEITQSGMRYVSALTNSERNDIILRQLLSLEIPSPIEPNFDNEIGQMKPFLFLIQILDFLYNGKHQGLNSFEIGVFLQPFRNHTQDEIKNTFNKILEYRTERESIDGGSRKKRFDEYTLDENRRLYNITKPNEYSQTKDYPDTTIRYSKLSGLITNSGRRVILREDKIDLINQIIKSPVSFYSIEEPILYLSNFYNGMESLPTDDFDVSVSEIYKLHSEINDSDLVEDVTLPIDFEINFDESELDRIRFSLDETLQNIRELKFANSQCEPDQIDDIIKYMMATMNRNKSIELGINSEKPAYLEWSIWRAFLAIDHIINDISDSRGFKVDDEIRPIHHSPGGRPDMFFQFESWGLVTEVSLSTGSRQVVTEGEPVLRHIFNQSVEGDGYGLFIAPRIDINTANSYLNPVWYDKEGDSYSLKIIPITIEQFTFIMEKYKSNPFSPDELKNFFDSIIIFRDDLNHPKRWLDKINELVDTFQN